MNLDVIKGDGTHWVCWYKKKNGDVCFYFDSFGISYPIEFKKYMKCDIIHSTYQIQKIGDIICGHLSILILYLLTVCEMNFSNALLTIINERKYFW
jgi:hypothetical protein